MSDQNFYREAIEAIKEGRLLELFKQLMSVISESLVSQRESNVLLHISEFDIRILLNKVIRSFNQYVSYLVIAFIVFRDNVLLFLEKIKSNGQELSPTIITSNLLIENNIRGINC